MVNCLTSSIPFSLDTKIIRHDKKNARTSKNKKKFIIKLYRACMSVTNSNFFSSNGAYKIPIHTHKLFREKLYIFYLDEGSKRKKKPKLFVAICRDVEKKNLKQ